VRETHIEQRRTREEKLLESAHYCYDRIVTLLAVENMPQKIRRSIAHAAAEWQHDALTALRQLVNELNRTYLECTNCKEHYFYDPEKSLSLEPICPKCSARYGTKSEATDEILIDGSTGKPLTPRKIRALGLREKPGWFMQAKDEQNTFHPSNIPEKEDEKNKLPILRRGMVTSEVDKWKKHLFDKFGETTQLKANYLHSRPGAELLTDAERKTLIGLSDLSDYRKRYKPDKFKRKK